MICEEQMEYACGGLYVCIRVYICVKYIHYQLKKIGHTKLFISYPKIVTFNENK